MKKLTRMAFRRFLWFVPFWYGLSMLLTRKRGVSVRGDFTKPADIALTLGSGHGWRRDPLSGALDVLSAPSRVQDRINKGKKIGDCDDHAMYWCVALLKSGLAERVRFSFVQMKKDNGKQSGHVVVTYDVGKEPYAVTYWADYGAPKVYSGALGWQWAIDVSARYFAKPIAAATIEVTLDRKGRPKFGRRRKRVRF